MPKPSAYLTVREAADCLGVSVQRVQQLIRSGKLPSSTRPFLWRKAVRVIPRKAVEARRASLPQKVTP